MAGHKVVVIVEPGQVAQMEAVTQSRRSTAIMKIKQQTMRSNNTTKKKTKKNKNENGNENERKKQEKPIKQSAVVN